MHHCDWKSVSVKLGVLNQSLRQVHLSSASAPEVMSGVTNNVLHCDRCLLVSFRHVRLRWARASGEVNRSELKVTPALNNSVFLLQDHLPLDFETFLFGDLAL